MKNKVFSQKSAWEKRRYLSSVLKTRSGGLMDDRMIGRVLKNVAINRQYRIRVFSDRRSFQAAAAHSRVIKSKYGANPVSAAVTRGGASALKKSGREINIWRGAKTWTKASRNG